MAKETIEEILTPEDLGIPDVAPDRDYVNDPPFLRGLLAAVFDRLPDDLDGVFEGDQDEVDVILSHCRYVLNNAPELVAVDEDDDDDEDYEDDDERDDGEYEG